MKPLSLLKKKYYSAALDKFYLRYTDPDLDGARLGVTGKGQMTLAGTRSQGQPTFYGDHWYMDAGGGKRS